MDHSTVRLEATRVMCMLEHKVFLCPQAIAWQTRIKKYENDDYLPMPLVALIGHFPYNIPLSNINITCHKPPVNISCAKNDLASQKETGFLFLFARPASERSFLSRLFRARSFAVSASSGKRHDIRSSIWIKPRKGMHVHWVNGKGSIIHSLGANRLALPIDPAFRRYLIHKTDKHHMGFSHCDNTQVYSN